MTEMKKHIYDENNGLWYERIGDYYIPVLTLSSEEQRPIGKWGRMHRDYLKEYRPILCNDLILSGQLWTYPADLNEQAQERLSLITESGYPVRHWGVPGRVRPETGLRITGMSVSVWKWSADSAWRSANAAWDW